MNSASGSILPVAKAVSRNGLPPVRIVVEGRETFVCFVCDQNGAEQRAAASH